MQTFPQMKKKLGFGMMRLPKCGEDVDYAAVNAMVDEFLACGFNYFDTATPYIDGKSELAVKKCLAERHPRSSFLLTNKLSGNLWSVGADIRPLVERQLQSCGVDYFDFYLMHAMNAERHEHYLKEGAYDIVRELVAEGKIRHMGISFHDSADVLDRILTDRPDIEVVQLQFNYADYDDPRVQSRLCYEVCVKHDKSVLVMEPVKGGSLANLPAEAAALLPNGSPASYAVRFAAGFENIVMVLSGMSDMAQLKDNTAYMTDFRPLSEEDLRRLELVKPIYQSRNRIPCTACRYCEENCPVSMPISTIFALTNRLHKKDAPAVGETAPADDYAALSVHADDCLSCGNCTAACPQHLRVQTLLAQAHPLLQA